MSLVERALKKMQENRAGVAPPMQTSAAVPAGAEALPDPTVAGRHGEIPVSSAVSPADEGAGALPAAHRSEAARPEGMAPTITIEAAVVRVTPQAKWHIDRAALQRDGVLPPAEQERLIVEQYRRIKRPLIANLQEKGDKPTEHARCIMMTSALPGDGKTYTSINLAFSLAREKDTTCLLIDADVAKPHISGIFGLQEERGLLDALTDDSVDVESLVLPTDVSGLYLLPAGKPIEGATELLASARMQTILERLNGVNSKRICLFDSPPLLLSSESRVLVNLMGQIVLVVRAGVTPKQAVFDAIGNIEESKYVGLILNQSEIVTSGGYYGYGYGYGVYGNPPAAGK